MKKYLVQVFVFSVILIVAFVLIIISSTLIVKSRGFKNYETDSNTLIISENKKYDIMFSGISHARNFSRYKNHLRLETILKKSIINIGQGSNMCGISEQYFYLKYFYSKNNTVDKLIYVLTPPLMYSETLPVVSTTFRKEAFEVSFLHQYLLFDTENKWQRIFNYLRSKMHPAWLFHYPKSKAEMTMHMTQMDSLIYNDGFRAAYTKGINPERFQKSSKVIEEEINFSIENNIKFIIIIPPALFGRWPGHQNVALFAQKMKEKYQIDYYDLSESVLDPKYYYDHHHLNTKGVVFFTENYLKDILN